MIDQIETCLVDTCVAIGLNAAAVFSKSNTPDVIAYDPSAQYEALGSTHRPINPRITRKTISASECRIIKLLAETEILMRLAFISVSESVLENLLIQFLKEIPKKIAWDENMDIAIFPQDSTRGDYIEGSSDPVDYKELAIQIRFASMVYESQTEPPITIVNLVPKNYDGQPCS